MVKLYPNGVFLRNGREVIEDGSGFSKDEARKGTISSKILDSHGKLENGKLRIKFDCLASHDITYVNIIQTARASGLESFPVPYVLTNCHNSLCAVGGTINEDDHVFGLTAAQKLGGIFVPAHMAVIHQYMREAKSGCGRMILGSDSHTRYGALGTMAIGEGGGELVKQLLSRTYDLTPPEIAGVYLKGTPPKGTGPQDVALSVIKEVFASGFAKNKIMEFVGDGISGLSIDFRNGVDVMTTETACLSSIWETDEKVQEYYQIHGRPEEYKKLSPDSLAYYDCFIEVDLSSVEPMIALPVHPSNVYSIRELNENLEDIINACEKECRVQMGTPSFSLSSKIRDGKLWSEQGVIAGCAGGTFENICEAASILKGKTPGSGEFALSVYPASQPIYAELTKNGRLLDLITSGASIRSAFCGPCFGAGDVPSNNSLSVRHTTRNFPNREGAKPANDQIASVALMDARSVAATALNGGAITSAADLDYEIPDFSYSYNPDIYKNRVYNGWGKPDKEISIKLGPNIKDWPLFLPLPENLLLKIASFITDPVTTTDELIPSGDTSSYRSNPIALSEFTLSRKDPGYAARAKAIRSLEEARRNGTDPAKLDPDLDKTLQLIQQTFGSSDISFASAIYAVKPGDGSAREQAASCQRVLGGLANISKDYATKRYRSNLANWGLLPFVFEQDPQFELGSFIYIPNLRQAVSERQKDVSAYVVHEDSLTCITLSLPGLSEEEAETILAGCLMNLYKSNG
ncbi:MAG: hydratase [Clostridiales bacterium]|nr:hydratase [Clostridiales bacterium]